MEPEYFLYDLRRTAPPPEAPQTVCPNCHTSQAASYYRDTTTGKIVGCDQCIEEVDYSDIDQTELDAGW